MSIVMNMMALQNSEYKSNGILINEFSEFDEQAYEDTVREFDEQAYKDSVEESIDALSEQFEEISHQKLIISLIGDANAGKSATVNALTGRKLSTVSGISGWTKEITLHAYADNVFIADTPGLNDTSTPDLAERAHEFVEKDTDIVLFFVNAASSRSPAEAKAFQSIRKLGKPTIVVLNKIDTIEPKKEIDNILNDLKKRFDYNLIVPISATKEVFIDVLSKKITEVLETQGKDLLFLKITKYKEARVKLWINGASVASIGIGAIPIPGSDIIPLTSVQVTLCLKIG